MDSIFSYKRSDEPDFYDILGCNELSTQEQIVCEYKVRALECHPDKHPDDQEAEHKFKLLQKAKTVLTDIEKRKEYDTWRSAGFAMSFEQWSNMSKNAHKSMHWATKRRTDPMLESSSDVGVSSSSFPSKLIQSTEGLEWARDSHENLRKFRNYEI
jgi:DnaJ family protein C protein 12